ncbi:LOW QUALITY PROTEIN: hypothetical protein Cgig2_010943 [Carnegiea gigantea]|uniref:Uncharacterized protein n=1 Tax=Carnegiea gigantea TaxID=171969 RepID=A0A9Q1QAI9_9CARY|nr:LOW QUALITY PROTEIN: hypothetical protein Cgig2_010943 [Carnegiea gigantea]
MQIPGASSWKSRINPCSKKPCSWPHDPKHETQYEFHEQNDHMMVRCWELKKALYELADKGQIDHFPRHRARAFDKGKAKAHKCSLEDCSTKIIATVARGYTKVSVPTMTFSGQEGRPIVTPHDNPLVVELKVANALVRMTLMDTGSSTDVTVNPIGIIGVLLWFGDKVKSRSLEVDFLVVDVPLCIIFSCAR